MNTLYLYEDDVSEKIAGWSALWSAWEPALLINRRGRGSTTVRSS